MTSAVSLLSSTYGFYLLAVMSPGPNTFIIMRLGLTRSRREALTAIFGIATGNAIWLAMVLGGLSALLRRVPFGFQALQVLGGLYLVYLGLFALRPARTASPEAGTPGALTRGAFKTGLTVSLSNPNTLPFYLSILAPALAAEVSVALRAAAAGGILAIAIGWYSAVGWMASHPRARRAYVEQERTLRWAMAAMMIGYGLRLLLPLWPR